MNEEENILHGPQPSHPVEDGTAGQQLYKALLTYVKKPKALAIPNEMLRSTSGSPETFIKISESQIDAKTGESISYKQLLTNTCLLAQSLKNVGIMKNSVISICSENNLFFLYPTIAALYIGAIVVPLNANYTKQELTNSLEISKPQLIFCSKLALHKILELNEFYSFIKKIVILDSCEDIENIECFDNFISRNSNKSEDVNSFFPSEFDRDTQVAFIMSSSGTTGLPKGVQLTHKNIVTAFSQSHDTATTLGVDLTPGHTILSLLPMFHVGGLFTMLRYIIQGAEIILIQRYDPELFLKSIQDYKVEAVAVVPTILVYLAKSPLVNKYNLLTLKDIGVSAGSLSRDIQETVMKRLNTKFVRQAYGLTETTLTITTVPKDDIRIGSSGKLVPYASAKIVDPNTQKAMSRNQYGEVYFKGDMIMKGYIGNEEANRNVFDKDGWLKTGDLGYFDNDGHLYIVGRLKEVIKYKSFQVSPTELEELLLKHPDIKDAAVIGIPDEESGELPAAFIALQPKKELSEEAIQEYVAGQVSSSKRLRGGVHFLNEIPKNSTGKVQKMSLRELMIKLKSTT